jgi:hypothetical protein
MTKWLLGAITGSVLTIWAFTLFLTINANLGKSAYVEKCMIDGYTKAKCESYFENEPVLQIIVPKWSGNDKN